MRHGTTIQNIFSNFCQNDNARHLYHTGIQLTHSYLNFHFLNHPGTSNQPQSPSFGSTFRSSDLQFLDLLELIFCLLPLFQLYSSMFGSSKCLFNFPFTDALIITSNWCINKAQSSPATPSIISQPLSIEDIERNFQEEQISRRSNLFTLYHLIKETWCREGRTK